MRTAYRDVKNQIDREDPVLRNSRLSVSIPVHLDRHEHARSGYKKIKPRLDGESMLEDPKWHQMKMSLPLSDQKNIDIYQENCCIKDFLELEGSKNMDGALFEKDIEVSEENEPQIVVREEDKPIQKDQLNSVVILNLSKSNVIQETGKQTVTDQIKVV